MAHVASAAAAEAAEGGDASHPPPLVVARFCGRARQLADFGTLLPAPSADALCATLYGHSTWVSGASFPARSAYALPGTLYGHLTKRCTGIGLSCSTQGGIRLMKRGLKNVLKDLL
jgi:hypothetical protein